MCATMRPSPAGAEPISAATAGGSAAPPPTSSPLAANSPTVGGKAAAAPTAATPKVPARNTALRLRFAAAPAHGPASPLTGSDRFALRPTTPPSPEPTLMSRQFQNRVVFGADRAEG